MKTRSGFVSNSSSSSFVVEIRDSFPSKEEKEDYLTPQEISKLLEYGFIYTNNHSPICIENLVHDQWVDEGSDCNYLGYHDNINEDDKIYFLVKNNIPFKGVTHYGHNSVFYERDGKEIVFIRNSGLAVSMYWSSEKRLRGLDNKRTIEDAIGDRPIIERIPKEEYLKEQEEFMKDFYGEDYMEGL